MLNKREAFKPSFSRFASTYRSFYALLLDAIHIYIYVYCGLHIPSVACSTLTCDIYVRGSRGAP